MEKKDFIRVWKTFELITIGFILLGVLLVLYFIRELLTPFIIAFVIVFFLNPIVNYIEGEGIHRTFAVVILIILTIISIFIIWKLAWPTIEAEISSFKENAPLYLSKTQESLNRAMKLLEKNVGFVPEGVIQKALQQKISDFTSRMGDVGSLVRIVKGLVTTLILIQVVVFFLLKDGRRIKKMVIALVPNKYFETFLTLFYEIDRQISNYIKGVVLDALIVSILATIGLYLLGIRYAILIGAVAGMANIIPYFGPLLGMIFGSLLVLIDTGAIMSVLKVIGVFAFVKLLDDIMISPLAVSRSVNVHPLMVIILVLLGGLFHGIWGMLLSVPLYCSLRVSFRILYRGFVEYGNW
jgi:putative permease